MASTAKGFYDFYDHMSHGNPGRAVASVVKSEVQDLVTCGNGWVFDAKDVAHDLNKTQYRGRGRPRNSDYNHNGYK